MRLKIQETDSELLALLTKFEKTLQKKKTSLSINDIDHLLRRIIATFSFLSNTKDPECNKIFLRLDSVFQELKTCMKWHDKCEKNQVQVVLIESMGHIYRMRGLKEQSIDCYVSYFKIMMSTIRKKIYVDLELSKSMKRVFIDLWTLIKREKSTYLTQKLLKLTNQLLEMYRMKNLPTDEAYKTYCRAKINLLSALGNLEESLAVSESYAKLENFAENSYAKTHLLLNKSRILDKQNDTEMVLKVNMQIRDRFEAYHPDFRSNAERCFKYMESLRFIGLSKLKLDLAANKVPSNPLQEYYDFINKNEEIILSLSSGQTYKDAFKQMQETDVAFTIGRLHSSALEHCESGNHFHALQLWTEARNFRLQQNITMHDKTNVLVAHTSLDRTYCACLIHIGYYPEALEAMNLKSWREVDCHIIANKVLQATARGHKKSYQMLKTAIPSYRASNIFVWKLVALKKYQKALDVISKINLKKLWHLDFKSYCLWKLGRRREACDTYCNLPKRNKLAEIVYLLAYNDEAEQELEEFLAMKNWSNQLIQEFNDLQIPSFRKMFLKLMSKVTHEANIAQKTLCNSLQIITSVQSSLKQKYTQ